MSTLAQSIMDRAKRAQGGNAAEVPAPPAKKAPAKRKPTKEHEAMEFAIDKLIEHGIKPKMTLKEYAEFTGKPLHQIQSDAKRNYLPLMKPVTGMDKELKFVNVAAVFAASFIEGMDYITNPLGTPR